MFRVLCRASLHIILGTARSGLLSVHALFPSFFPLLLVSPSIFVALCSQDTGLEAFNDSEMVAPTEYHPPWESIYARQYISCEFSDRLIPPDIIITFQQLRL